MLFFNVKQNSIVRSESRAPTLDIFFYYYYYYYKYYYYYYYYYYY